MDFTSLKTMYCQKKGNAHKTNVHQLVEIYDQNVKQKENVFVLFQLMQKKKKKQT